MTRKLLYPVFALLLTIHSPAGAEEAAPDPLTDRARPAPAPFTFHVYVENDGQLFKPNRNTDRYYTSGVRFVFTHEPACAMAVAEALDWIPLGGEGPERAGFVYSYGHEIYTPDDIERRVPDPDDRPYAGWLYGSIALDRATTTVYDRFEIDLGVVGPSARGDEFQNDVHDIFGGDEAKGWDAQIGDEFGFNFYYTRKWKIAVTDHAVGAGDNRFAVEIIPSAGFALGNIDRRADVGAVFRFGQNLPDDFGPGRVDDPVAAFGQWPRDFGWYGFLRLGGHAVEHDLFIEGNTWRDPSPGVDEKAFWGEVQVGVFVYCHWLQIGYAQTYETRRFEDQDGSHGYGLWTVSARFDF